MGSIQERKEGTVRVVIDGMFPGMTGDQHLDWDMRRALGESSSGKRNGIDKNLLFLTVWKQ